MSDQKAGDKPEDFAAFFRVKQHDFPKTEQQQWSDFAVTTANNCANILRVTAAGSADVSLLDLLELIARERNAFAKTQPELNEAKRADFGRWRDGVYDRTVDQGRQVVLRRSALNAALQRAGYPPVSVDLDVRASLTMYEQVHPLFQGVVDNLERCAKEDPGAVSVTDVNSTSHEIVSNVIRNKLTISPANFFDVAKFHKYQLFDDTTQSRPFTNFFVLSYPQPTFFVIMEHPTPRKVSQMMFGDMNERFKRLLTLREDTGYLAALADFGWYCHQLMPFERGSASIFLILTAALLSLGNVPFKPYHGNRLDIDAISLTRELFGRKFIDSFTGR